MYRKKFTSMFSKLKFLFSIEEGRRTRQFIPLDRMQMGLHLACNFRATLIALCTIALPYGTYFISHHCPLHQQQCIYTSISTKHRTLRRIWVSHVPSGAGALQCCVYILTTIWCHKLPPFHYFCEILLHADLCDWKPRILLCSVTLLAIPGLVMQTSHICDDQQSDVKFYLRLHIFK